MKPVFVENFFAATPNLHNSEIKVLGSNHLYIGDSLRKKGWKMSLDLNSFVFSKKINMASNISTLIDTILWQ